MIKRTISIIISFCIIISMIGFSAFADETDFPNYWIELIDYGYANGTNSNFVSLRSSTRTIIQYAYPGQGEIERCEILIKTDSSTFRVSTMNEYLSVTNLGSGMYRLAGRIADGRPNSTVAEFFVLEADGTYVEVLSFRVSTKSFESYVKSASGNVHINGVGDHSLTYPNDDINNRWVIYDNAEMRAKSFYAEFSVDGWSTMNYIQTNFFVYASSIDSIVVTVGGMSVPFEVNYIYTDSRSSTEALSYIWILTDVSNLPNLGNTLDIKISGYISSNSQFHFSLVDCFGFIDIPEPSLWTYWFTQVGSWISNQTSAIVSPIITWGQNIVSSVSTWGQNIVNAIVGNANSDDFNQGVSDANDKLSDASDAMNDFTRPAADSVVPDLGDFDSSSVDILSQFFNNHLVSPMVTAGLAVWLIGIIFGV